MLLDFLESLDPLVLPVLLGTAVSLDKLDQEDFLALKDLQDKSVSKGLKVKWVTEDREDRQCGDLKACQDHLAFQVSLVSPVSVRMAETVNEVLLVTTGNLEFLDLLALLVHPATATRQPVT